MVSSSKQTLAVDFDGTIVDHRFPYVGSLKPGVREALLMLSPQFEIVISSCRASSLFKKFAGLTYVQEMKDFLDDNQIPYDRIDMGDEGKVIADAYIDDKAVRFTDWDSTLRVLGVYPASEKECQNEQFPSK